MLAAAGEPLTKTLSETLTETLTETLSETLCDPTGYRIKLERIEVEGGNSLQIRSLLDRMQFSDDEGVAQELGISSAQWPLFGLVWPAAQKLADLMQTWVLPSGPILEIGCGLALASLVIHRRLGDITASDCHPLTQIFLNHNLALNNLPCMKYRQGHWFRDNPGLGKFSLIIGSDVLYDRMYPPQLAQFIQLHANTSARVLIVDPNRGNSSSFSKCMKNYGFSLHQRMLSGPLFDESPFRGRLMDFQREMGAAG